jgi:hypothetical protein
MIDDVNGDARRPLRALSIRELVLELSNIEELVVRQTDAVQNSYATRFVTQREQLIIAELRNRAARLPALGAGCSATDAGGTSGWES